MFAAFVDVEHGCM